MNKQPNIIQQMLAYIFESDIPDYQKKQKKYKLLSRTFRDYTGPVRNVKKALFQRDLGIHWKQATKKQKKMFNKLYRRGLISGQ